MSTKKRIGIAVWTSSIQSILYYELLYRICRTTFDTDKFGNEF